MRIHISGRYLCAPAPHCMVGICQGTEHTKQITVLACWGVNRMNNKIQYLILDGDKGYREDVYMKGTREKRTEHVLNSNQ